MIVEPWPEGGVTSRVRRGSFIIPADVIERAEVTGDDYEIRRLFAAGIPMDAKPTRRERVKGIGLRVHWRAIRVVPRYGVPAVGEGRTALSAASSRFRPSSR